MGRMWMIGGALSRTQNRQRVIVCRRRRRPA